MQYVYISLFYLAMMLAKDFFLQILSTWFLAQMIISVILLYNMFFLVKILHLYNMFKVETADLGGRSLHSWPSPVIYKPIMSERFRDQKSKHIDLSAVSLISNKSPTLIILSKQVNTDFCLSAKTNINWQSSEYSFDSWEESWNSREKS